MHEEMETGLIEGILGHCNIGSCFTRTVFRVYLPYAYKGCKGTNTYSSCFCSRVGGDVLSGLGHIRRWVRKP